jgi:hypothetical protein
MREIRNVNVCIIVSEKHERKWPPGKSRRWCDDNIKINVKLVENKWRIWGSHSGGYESAIFWDITPCSPLSVSRRFEEHISFIFRGTNKPSKKPAWKQVAATCFHAGILFSLMFRHSTDYTALYPREWCPSVENKCVNYVDSSDGQFFMLVSYFAYS